MAQDASTTSGGRPDIAAHRLGTYETGRSGPVFVFVGGMHGNEPAGVFALQELLAELLREQLPLRGRLVAFAGNLEALRRGARYLDADLNRLWSRAVLAMPHDVGPAAHERATRDALLEEIEREIEGATEPVIFLDLHSTSASGSPFSIIGDTLQNRRIAFAFPVPVILGLEENVDGALLGYFGERGHIAVGFEGGQHDDEQTRANQLAAAWITLVEAGGLVQSETPQARHSFERLRIAGRGLPGVVEMRYRHHVTRRESFVMRPGFTNFDRVEAGEVLATDRGSEIRAAEPGLVLLPLYQGQGEDGFFLGREVRRFWLRLSRGLRALRVGALLPYLPGVHRVADEPGVLEVDRRVALVWVVEVFHLLGFRRRQESGRRLRFSRRVEGLRR